MSRQLRKNGHKIPAEDTMQDFSIKCKMNRIFQIVEIMVMKYFIITIKEKRNENVKSRAAGFIVIWWNLWLTRETVFWLKLQTEIHDHNEWAKIYYGQIRFTLNNFHLNDEIVMRWKIIYIFLLCIFPETD